MHILTNHVRPEEPCMGGWEGYEMAPIPDAPNGATGWRWLQKIFVVRDDTIAKFVTDYGPAEDYEDRITPIIIPCNGEYDVAAIQWLLEKNRHDTYWQERAQAQLAESTLIWDLIEQQDKVGRIVQNQTTSGPYGTVQRDGYAREKTARDRKQRRIERTGKQVFF